MSHGLQIFDAAGNVRLDVSDRITRVLDDWFAEYDESGTQTVAGFDANRGTIIAMASYSPKLGDARLVSHSVSINGEEIYYSPAGTSSDSATHFVAVLYK